VTGATSAYSVTAVVSDTTALKESSTTSALESSTVTTNIPPNSSAQLVLTGVYLASPITFSGQGQATYTWCLFDGGQFQQAYDTTVTFSDYQTTVGFTSAILT